MNIVFFGNPNFFSNKKVPAFMSMPRYVRMLADGMRQRGHTVEVWSPSPRFFKIPVKKARKWLGYMDQYLLFPMEVRRRLKKCPSSTLFVFTDQTQGPWVSLIRERHHVIHCHDFLAQYSALGKIPENPTGITGRYYQKMIRRGYNKGTNFISVSEKTRVDLHDMLWSKPSVSEVIYNGLNKDLAPIDTQLARTKLGSELQLDLSEGYLLHVGGNQWYKNKAGVIRIYDAWRSSSQKTLPLLLIGEPLSDEIRETLSASPFHSDIHVYSGVTDDFVQLAYSGATVLVYPSLAEGFGWPIAEAMAAGCPVITTNESPMTEVAGEAGFLIPRLPRDKALQSQWATDATTTVDHIVSLTAKDRGKVVAASIQNAKRFDADKAIDQMEKVYKRIVD